MLNETQLWSWFIFESGLAPQRAKFLLSQWQSQNLSLQDVMAQLPRQAAQLKLTKDEAHKLTPPPTYPQIHALRWNEPLYPQGLHELSPKLQPALWFYIGEKSLLVKPILYLLPNTHTDISSEKVREIVNLVLDEGMLVAALEQSQQAAVLLEEMGNSEGEGLLFAKRGTKHLSLSPDIQKLVDAGRLLITSPLPPDHQGQPALETVLRHVALAAATRCIGFSSPDETASLTRPTLALVPNSEQRENAPHVEVAKEPTDVLSWMADLTVPTPQAENASPPSAPPEEPPLTPEETLNILKAGGHVPEALRKRLLDMSKK